MNLMGPKLVIPGAILGSMLLAFFLYTITAGFVYPTETVLAAPEAEENMQSDPSQTGDLAASQANADPALANNAASTDCRVSSKFPGEVLQWCGLITQYAEQFGLPIDLVASVIWQESGGNPSAYSKSGAVGLMQVMPNDGLAANFMCKNGPCFSDRPSTEKLQDPDFNVMYGTRMLSGLVNKHGNFRDALRAYGPMDVGYYYADIVLNIFENHKQ